MELRYPEQRPAYSVPAGYGFRKVPLPELKQLTSVESHLQIYQYPRRGHRYILGVDVSDGVEKDDSVIDVMRMGTIDEPEEQVAQYCSNTIAPSELAYIVDAIGHLYKWPDGREAMAAIETNNHGLVVQDTLQNHLGYRNFYVWEVLDQADPAKRFTTKLGWATTSRTRPILLASFKDAVCTLDPLTGYSDCRLNSSISIDQLRDFQTDGALWEAEAARGAKDDAILAGAIAHFVAWRLMAGEREPLADRRRRRHQDEMRRTATSGPEKLDYRNSDQTAQQMSESDPRNPVEQLDDTDELTFDDPSGRALGSTLY